MCVWYKVTVQSVCVCMGERSPLETTGPFSAFVLRKTSGVSMRARLTLIVLDPLTDAEPVGFSKFYKSGQEKTRRLF